MAESDTLAWPSGGNMSALKFFYSSVGAKVVMAVTGFLLFIYVLGHMLGNWQVFAGPERLNAYAEFLHSHMGLLWTARAVLFVCLVLHVWSASRLTLDNRAARPVSYVVNRPVKAGLASRNMYLTGAMIFFFVTYHILQFTVRVTNPEYATLRDAQGNFNVYAMVVEGFSNPLISAVYIIAMILLGIHLWHGISSMFQSLGLVRPRYRRFVDTLGPAIASIIIVGEIAMPISILAGFVH
jgi:succinate dehydrogenase / fumarate reductase cytochrome b subunit